MDFIPLFFSGFLIGLSGAMTPGQDTMIVLHSVSTGGKSGGVRASFGIGIALIFHATLTLLIIFVLDKTFGRYARQTLQAGGVIYLTFFAYSLLIHQKEKEEDNSQKLSSSLTKRSYFVNGFFSNLFNSKALLYFTSIVLPFIDPDNFIKGVVFLSGILIAIPLWFVCLSIGLSKVIDRITPRWYRMIEVTSALLFLAVACYGLISLFGI